MRAEPAAAGTGVVHSAGRAGALLMAVPAVVGLEVGAREVRHWAVAAARALVGGIRAVLAAKRRAQLLGLVVE